MVFVKIGGHNIVKLPHVYNSLKYLSFHQFQTNIETHFTS